MAIIFGVGGVLWHFPRVTRTDGIIVESVALAGAQNQRLITYEYTAYGARHRGQRLLGWGRSIPPGFFEVGQSFPVYFDTDKPDFSYAPYPPEKTLFIVSGITFAVLGAGLILLGSRARQVTNL
jgi:hypothetical protein